jgi:hypothetical protein
LDGSETSFSSLFSCTGGGFNQIHVRENQHKQFSFIFFFLFTYMCFFIFSSPSSYFNNKQGERRDGRRWVMLVTTKGAGWVNNNVRFVAYWFQV